MKYINLFQSENDYDNEAQNLPRPNISAIKANKKAVFERDAKVKLKFVVSEGDDLTALTSGSYAWLANNGQLVNTIPYGVGTETINVTGANIDLSNMTCPYEYFLYVTPSEIVLQPSNGISVSSDTILPGLCIMAGNQVICAPCDSSYVDAGFVTRDIENNCFKVGKTVLELLDPESQGITHWSGFVYDLSSGVPVVLDTICTITGTMGGVTLPYNFDSPGDYLLEVGLKYGIFGTENEFDNNKTLVSVEADRYVQSIGNRAFAYASELQTAKIYSGTIGQNAFSSCKKLSTVVLGPKVTDIGWGAFINCTNLQSIKIPDSVTTIDGLAFDSCTSLSAVTIGSGITQIQNAFTNCPSLPAYDNAKYADTLLVTAINTEITSCIIKDGTKWINTGAFEDCTNLTNIVIPDSVTTINQHSFLNCTNLHTVVIGKNVTKYGVQCFRNCTSLSSITCLNPVAQGTYYAYVFDDVAPTGTFYYPAGSDYSSWISNLPSGWKAQAI